MASTLDRELERCDAKKTDIKPAKLMPPLPMRGLWCGQSGAGKTRHLLKMLCDKQLGLKSFDSIVWIAPRRSIEGQGKLKLLRDKWKEYVTFLPVDSTVPMDELNQLLEHSVRNKWATLIVCDDLMNLPRKQRQFMRDLACHGRHSNLSFIECNQVAFSGNRTERLQATTLCLFNIQRGEVARLAKDLCSSKAKADQLVQCYSKVIEKDPHGCLILDLAGPSTAEWPCRARHTAWDRFIPSLSSL